MELPGKEIQEEQGQILLLWCCHGLAEFTFGGMAMTNICNILSKFLWLVLEIPNQPHQ